MPDFVLCRTHKMSTENTGRGKLFAITGNYFPLLLFYKIFEYFDSKTIPTKNHLCLFTSF